MTTRATTNDDEWQRVVQWVTINSNKWEQIRMSNSEWQHENEWEIAK